MKRKRFMACVLAICGLFLWSAPVMAQGGKIRVGNLKIVPSLSLEEVSDDNIYLGNGSNSTSELKESDWITHVKPGLVLDYTIEGRGSVSIGYEGDLAYYDKNDKNDWKSHTGLFNLDYEAPGGLIVILDNTYTDTQDPFGGYAEYNLGQKTERWSDDLQSELGFKLGSKLKIFLYYNYYKQDYKDDANDYAQDFYSHEGGTGVEMRLLPKTWGFIRYYYGLQDYDTGGTTGGATTDESNDSDFTWHKVDMGLTWESGAKISGELNFGYQAKKYDNDLTAAGDQYDDKNTWVAATSIFYDLVTAEDGTMITQLGLTLDRALKQSGSNTENYYEDTGVGFSLKQKLRTKITLEGSFSYNFHDYYLPLTQNREDDNYEADISVDYQARDWLSAGVAYTYKEKHSNDDSNNYKDNQFKFTVSAEY